MGKIWPHGTTPNTSMMQTDNQRTFFLSLKWDYFKWLKTSYKELLFAPLNQKFFEKHFPEETIWIEKLTYKKGTTAEISLLHGNGGLNKFFVPVGEERKGWIDFFNLIGNYPCCPLKNQTINQTQDLRVEDKTIDTSIDQNDSRLLIKSRHKCQIER